MPFAVLLVVPMCLLSACIGLWMFKQDLNIFVQVGFIVLVGLAAKNAIPIVETAWNRKNAGESRFDAAVNAGKSCLRPIIMTSFAFILGCCRWSPPTVLALKCVARWASPCFSECSA